MKLPTYRLLCLLIWLTWGTVSADSNFTSNPKLPFPPSCVNEIAPAPKVIWYEWQIELTDRLSNEAIPFYVTIDRVPCAESGRSVILFDLILRDDFADRDFEVALPTVSARPLGDDFTYAMTLVPEFNGQSGWGNMEQQYIYLVSRPRTLEGPTADAPLERHWRFLLQGNPSLFWIDPSYRNWWGMSPTEYNGRFRLYYEDRYIDMWPTDPGYPLTTPLLPLSGRHSGTWVIEGAKNQGFQLSISEQVGLPADTGSGIPARPLVAFLSQYTFDADHQPLWLVGNAEFTAGATEVTIDMYRVSDGRFRGDQAAQREYAGQVTLSSKNCNDVEFSFDYDPLGLGAGNRRLVRLFSLETAGYECRDYEARVAANH